MYKNIFSVLIEFKCFSQTKSFFKNGYSRDRVKDIIEKLLNREYMILTIFIPTLLLRNKSTLSVIVNDPSRKKIVPKYSCVALEMLYIDPLCDIFIPY